MAQQTSTSNGATTVDRALALLDLLASAEPDGITASELARRLRMNRSTAYRILSTLMAREYARQIESRFHLGFRVLEVADMLLGSLDLRRVAHEEVRELSLATGETCHLGVLDGADVVYLDKAESLSNSLRMVSRPGKHVPAHATSLGKAILSAMPAARREQVLSSLQLTRLTEHTITDRQQLEADIAKAHARGWAVDLGENEVGVTCVGAPILDRSGMPTGALSASGPNQRMTDTDRIGKMVKSAADRVSAQISGIG